MIRLVASRNGIPTIPLRPRANLPPVTSSSFSKNQNGGSMKGALTLPSPLRLAAGSNGSNNVSLPHCEISCTGKTSFFIVTAWRASGPIVELNAPLIEENDPQPTQRDRQERMRDRQQVLDADGSGPLAVIRDERDLFESGPFRNETRQEFRLIPEACAFHMETQHMRPQIQRIAVVVCDAISARQIHELGIELGYDLASQPPVPNFHEMRQDDIGSATGMDDFLQ